MLSFLRYVYYRIYIWNRNNWGESDQPWFNAMLGVTFLMYLNIITIINLVLYLFGTFMQEDKNNYYKIVIALFGLSLLAINYFFLFGGKKHFQIVVLFQNETRKQKNIGTIKLGLYVFLSFAIPTISGILYHKYHS